MKKILLIDSDREFVGALAQTLEAHGYAVTVAHRAADGLRTALALRPDVIVTEAMLETDTAGFEFIYQLRSQRDFSRYREISATPVILLTAINQATHFRFSLNEQASYLPPTSAVLTKPVQIEVLLGLLQELTAG